MKNWEKDVRSCRFRLKLKSKQIERIGKGMQYGVAVPH